MFDPTFEFEYLPNIRWSKSIPAGIYKLASKKRQRDFPDEIPINKKYLDDYNDWTYNKSDYSDAIEDENYNTDKIRIDSEIEEIESLLTDIQQVDT